MKPLEETPILRNSLSALKYLLWLAHAVAACSIFLATLPLGARIVLLLVVLASWISHTPAILNYFSPQIKRLLKTGFLSCSRLESGAVLLVLGGDGQLKKVSEEARNIGSDRTAFSRVITATPITDGGNASHAESITLQPQTLVLPFLVVLLYRKESRSRLQALLVLSDSLSAEDFRYLRIWLRWQVKWHIETDA